MEVEAVFCFGRTHTASGKSLAIFTHQSAVVSVREESQIGEARRTATYLAGQAGFDETQTGRVAIVTTEAARNLVHHAGPTGGEIVVQIVSEAVMAGTGGVAGVEPPVRLDLYALDKGPGMRSVAECLRDGFSTAGTAGQGMGAMQRLADDFEVYSRSQAGTVVYAGFRADGAGKSASRPAPNASLWQIGVISLAKTGESECGDSWGVRLGAAESRFIVADGLGHGPMAAEASCAALHVFHEPTIRPLPETMERIHGELRSTRGAAISIVSIDAESRKVGFVGIGNVAGALVNSSGSAQSMVGHNGTVGAQMHKVHEFGYDLPEGGMTVLASDGLTTQWKLDQYPGLLHRHPALIAGVLYRDCNRGRDDATVLVVRAVEA